MKFGRRNFLKGLASAAAGWMVKPELPKLEDLLEEEQSEEKENDEKWPTSCNDCNRKCSAKCPRSEVAPGVHAVRMDDWPKDCGHCWLYPCDDECPNHDWPVSCSACHFYACHKDCPRHVENPYFHHFNYGDTWRSLEEQQDRR